MLSTTLYAALSHFDGRLETQGECCHLVVNHVEILHSFNQFLAALFWSSLSYLRTVLPVSFRQRWEREPDEGRVRTPRPIPGGALEGHPQLHGHATQPLTGTQPGPHQPDAISGATAGRRWRRASPRPVTHVDVTLTDESRLFLLPMIQQSQRMPLGSGGRGNKLVRELSDFMWTLFYHRVDRFILWWNTFSSSGYSIKVSQFGSEKARLSISIYS